MKKIRTINMDGSLLKVVKYRPTVTRGNTEVKQPRLDISIKGPPACVPYSILLNYSNENEIENYQINSYQIISNQLISNQIKSNQIKSNQIKLNQIKSNQIKSNQIKKIRSLDQINALSMLDTSSVILSSFYFYSYYSYFEFCIISTSVTESSFMSCPCLLLSCPFLHYIPSGSFISFTYSFVSSF